MGGLPGPGRRGSRGKGYEFDVELLGVCLILGQIARDGVRVDIKEATGGLYPAPLAEMLEDGQGRVIGQLSVLKNDIGIRTRSQFNFIEKYRFDLDA